MKRAVDFLVGICEPVFSFYKDITILSLPENEKYENIKQLNNSSFRIWAIKYRFLFQWWNPLNYLKNVS